MNWDFDLLNLFSNQLNIRWHVSVPLGVPHKSTQDDVYKGLFIPKKYAQNYLQFDYFVIKRHITDF